MKIISGGQSGVDQAALRAARALGLQTGGWAPRGWQTEDGPAPWLADYGLKEHADGYVGRTHANVALADATLILNRGVEVSGGTWLTIKIAERVVELSGQPCCLVDLWCSCLDLEVLRVREWLSGKQCINVAGPRESKEPGIGKLAELFLREVFVKESSL